MNPFAYLRVDSVEQAVSALARDPAARIIAGGTNLVDLMKYEVEHPSRLVDITRLPLDRIEETADGGLRVGTLVSNTELAYDPRVERRYPLLASAILAGASPQLRNAATVGGNVLQRTRCPYFYDAATPCNKRRPGSGCGALDGFNRNHAVLGTSEHCIATHPSDMCVALAALAARLRVVGKDGDRVIEFADFHRLPGDRPEIDTNLRHDEVILGIDLPADGFSRNCSYLKLRDRASYAFALVSVAAALALDGDRIAAARLALGGVAHKPWRVPEAEDFLRGRRATRENFADAAERMLSGASGRTHNGFKIELAKRAVVRALQQAASGTPQSQADKHIY